LQAEKAAAAIDPGLREVRDAEMPALKSALAALQGVDFPERASVVPDLGQRIKRLTALHEESATALLRPKAERRQGLAQDHMAETNALIEMLDKLSSGLNRRVKLDDAFIDQLFELKQLAWVVRDAAGDASVMVSNALSGQPLPSDPLFKFAAHVSKADTAWATLEGLAAGLPMPARFTAAVEKAKREMFAREYVELRTNTFKALVAGEKATLTNEQWTPITVPKLASALGAAEAALDIAKDYAAQQHASALWKLSMQLGLLVAALAFAGGMMLMVSRRVTGPLHMIQEAMLKVAAGDLSAEVSLGRRKDEIGALGSAMQAFKGSVIEADRLRAEQKETEGRAAARRKAEMQQLADEFQTAVGNIVGAVSSSSAELELAAGTLTKNAETTQRLSGVVASASEEASANVESVAAATEQMSGSVHEIARQVGESSRIATEAVRQAEQTDARITELSQAASRIGDGTCWRSTRRSKPHGPARRGGASRWWPRRSRRSPPQTAKATDEIGSQISSMQAATQDSVNAIKEIGATIGRIAEIASAITAAVEEQGATTQEISRNVQLAAQGTAQVATNITEVNRGASETGSASSQVLASAQTLARESGQLKIQVAKFVQMARAA
jgi:methyl-accepting chemotaxis protein